MLKLRNRRAVFHTEALCFDANFVCSSAQLFGLGCRFSCFCSNLLAGQLRLLLLLLRGLLLLLIFPSLHLVLRWDQAGHIEAFGHLA